MQKERMQGAFRRNQLILKDPKAIAAVQFEAYR
jgi:hypothetical protein